MSEVKRRTVYTDRIDGAYQFLDWAVVTFNTNDPSLSRMVEPYMVNNRYLSSTGLREYDPTDPAVRIDYIQRIDKDQLPKVLSGGVTGGTVLHGGTLTPTQGRGDMYAF